MTSYKELQNKADHVILSVGDIIVDSVGGHIGILTRRSHHIDMVEDDVYVWETKWINNVVKEFYGTVPTNTLLEGLQKTYSWIKDQVNSQ